MASIAVAPLCAGLFELDKVVKQATIRRNIVVQLIRMHRDAGHPDYQKVNMQDASNNKSHHHCKL